VLDHQRDGLLVQHGAVLDGVEADLDGSLDTGRAVAVAGDSDAELVRLPDRGCKLVRRPLERANVRAVRHHAAGHQQLDQVDPHLDPLANGPPSLVWPVDDALARHRDLWTVVAVAVPAWHRQRHAGGQDARPHQEPFVERLADGHVAERRRAQVADGRETGHEHRAGVRRAAQRLERNKILEALKLVVGGAAGGQVDV
jgi:hypothetical protein